MRRPALYRPTPASSAWAHPYTGVPGLAVFYNDGGDPPAGDPSPADPSPKPGPPAQRMFTQAEVEALAAKEKAQGKRSAAKEFAEKHGFGSVEDAETFIAAARKAQEDALSEQERQARQFEEERRRFEADKAAFATQQRALDLEKALTRLGAIDSTTADGQDVPNLQDALALLERELRDQPDADQDAIREAAQKIKTRRPELFGTPVPQQTTPAGPPPAPGGSPAGGTPPRTPASKDDVKARALALAQKMGYAQKPA